MPNDPTTRPHPMDMQALHLHEAARLFVLQLIEGMPRQDQAFIESDRGGVLAIEVTLPVDRAAVELVSRRADGARVLLLRLPVSSVHPNICECDACWKDREAIGWKRCHARLSAQGDGPDSPAGRE